MKTKIAATLLFAFFLLLSKLFLFNYTVKVFLDTTAKEGTMISYRYKTRADGAERTGKAVVKHDGYLPLVVPAKTVAWLKAELPAGAAVKSAKTKKDVLPAPENNAFDGLSLKGKTHFDFNVVLLAYMTLFWLWTLKNGLPAGEPRPPKMTNIEFLRILFTADVVLAHFVAWLGLPFAAGFPVEFFFVLSGYFLALKFDPAKTVPQIAKTRFIAWTPLIVFGCLLCNGNFKSFRAVFYLQTTGLAFDNVANAPSWYLAILFWVSIFYFCVFRAFKAETAKLITGTLSFVACVVCAQTGVGIWDRVGVFFPRGLITGTACVGVGIMLAQVCVRREDAAPSKALGFVELLLLCYVVAAAFVKGAAVTEWFVWVLLYTVLIALFVQKRGFVSRFFEKPVFAAASKYCLAVYLTHWVISNNFQLIVSCDMAWVYSHKAVVALLTLTASVLLGIIGRHAVEIPVGNWLRKKLG